VAASAGNHALGLAFHGAQLGVRVTVVVPSSAPEVKIARCRALGAVVLVHGGTFDEAQGWATEFAAASDATLIHPFDDLRVIAGQGTLALEFLEQAPELDTVVVPVGGGGMLAGVATAVKALRPDVRVIAVEPANAAGFATAQLSGHPTPTVVSPTLADGLAVACVGQNTFALASSLVDETVTVSESEIACAIAALARHCGAVVEGAGATALAAVLAGKVQGKSTVVPISGRNIDARLHQDIVASQPPLAPAAAAAKAA
jgi:threonine dehydratase